MFIHAKSFQCKLEISEKMPAITSYAGLGLLRETFKKLGLLKIMRDFDLKKDGYSDEVILEALILLLAAGGRSFSDWEYLAKESGFQLLYGKSQIASVDTLECYLPRLEVTELKAHIEENEDKKGRAGYYLPSDFSVFQQK